MEEETISDNPDLVVKYLGRYLTWDNASPVLASLAVYRKSLVDHPEHHRHVAQSSTSQPKGSHRRGWSLWWGRNRTPQDDAASVASAPTADVNGVASAPTSPPDSPKSLPITDTPPAMSPAPRKEDFFPEEDHTKHYAKTLRLTSDQLVRFLPPCFPALRRLIANLSHSQKELGLKKGMNTISFSVRSSYSGYATCTSRVFLWESDFQVVISDIDGTITKSVFTLSMSRRPALIAPSPPGRTLSDTSSR